jgi:hypothetical protein
LELHGVNRIRLPLKSSTYDLYGPNPRTRTKKATT